MMMLQLAGLSSSNPRCKPKHLMYSWRAMDVWERRVDRLFQVRDDPTSAHPTFMKFRFVLLQPDDDPDGHPPARENAAALTEGPSRTQRYAQRGTDMVRVERLKDGRWKSTPIANFT